MTRFALALARLSTAAWVGAAVLFVINGVRQLTFSGFDSIVRNQLALLRFPAYYAFGFALVICGLAGALAARDTAVLSRGRRRLAAGLLTAALIAMWIDYRFVFTPLAEMLTPPGAPKPQHFITYHHASEAINLLHVSLVFCAAVTLCVPARSVAHAVES